MTVIAGREGDIYEMFACRPAETELPLRVQHDRGLEDGSRLFDCTEGLPELGRETVALPAAPGRPATRQCWRCVRAGKAGPPHP